MHSKEKNCIKATITSLIVAFTYLIVIFLIIYILFSNSINKIFSIIDIIEILTETDRPRKYLDDLKRKIEKEQGDFQLSGKNRTGWAKLFLTGYLSFKWFGFYRHPL